MEKLKVFFPKCRNVRNEFFYFFAMVFPMDANDPDDFINLCPVYLPCFLDFLEKTMDFHQFRLNVRQIERDFPCNGFVFEKSRKSL